MAERGKGFPRLSLSGAIKIIDVASKFGKTWPKEQFAGFGSHSGAGSARSGAFAKRVSSLRDYGLITSTKDSISITELGIRISKPATESQREEAIKQAFLNVEVFKGLIEGLDSGTPLPMDQVSQYAVFNLGVSRESKDKFINVFIDSGRHIGMVEYDKGAATVTISQLSNNTGSSATGDESSADEQKLTSGVTTLPSFVPSVVTQVDRKSTTSSPLTEQGVNHAGEGWSLTVHLKTTARLDPESRKKVRDLLETADDLSDLLHSHEENGGTPM